MVKIFTFIIAALWASTDAAPTPIGREYYYATDLERITGIPESTWHYYAFARKGPPSLKLGRRRVWPIDEFRQWEAEQRAAERATP
jgi:prophage regulatory protein